jgi:hypothetical protein
MKWIGAKTEKPNAVLTDLGGVNNKKSGIILMPDFI